MSPRHGVARQRRGAPLERLRPAGGHPDRHPEAVDWRPPRSADGSPSAARVGARARLHRCSCATPGQIGVAVHDRIRIGARAHCAWLGSRWPPGEIVGKPGLDARMLSHSRTIGGVDRDAAAVPAQKCLVGAAGGAAGNGKQAKSKRQHRTERMPNVHAIPRLRSRQHRLARPARHGLSEVKISLAGDRPSRAGSLLSQGPPRFDDPSSRQFPIPAVDQSTPYPAPGCLTFATLLVYVRRGRWHSML